MKKYRLLIDIIIDGKIARKDSLFKYDDGFIYTNSDITINKNEFEKLLKKHSEFFDPVIVPLSKNDIYINTEVVHSTGVYISVGCDVASKFNKEELREFLLDYFNENLGE